MKLPDDWTIDIKVKPWMGCDISYGIKRQELTQEPIGLWFEVYSARYPNTWYDWFEVSVNEIAFHIRANEILKPKS